MKRLASVLNDLGNGMSDQGKLGRAIALHQLASVFAPSWSVPQFNLGLIEKQRLNWPSSLRHNQRAVELNTEDEGAWWNLGIAATALRSWDEAARAWKHCGLDTVEIRDDEVYAPCGDGCVRLNPQGEYPEVVWGRRLDPARIRIANIPLPRSKRKFRDIILNDGSEEGTRRREGDEYPVFDELEIWESSAYSTFSATLHLGREVAADSLEAVCEQFDVAREDWGSIRMFCEECSRGNPGPHICAQDPEATDNLSFGFAAKSREVLMEALAVWKESSDGSDYSLPRLELLAS